jgi:hypothetical protein
VSFRRGLVNENLTTWFDLVSKVAQVHLTKRKDVFRWNLSKNGLFTVRSMYKTLITSGVLSEISTSSLESKSTTKIKIFLWYLKKGVTLMKDNLVRRNWQGSVKFCFCSSVETIQHLFFDCHFASFVWNTVHITFGI